MLEQELNWKKWNTRFALTFKVNLRYPRSSRGELWIKKINHEGRAFFYLSNLISSELCYNNKGMMVKPSSLLPEVKINENSRHSLDSCILCVYFDSCEHDKVFSRCAVVWFCQQNSLLQRSPSTRGPNQSWTLCAFLFIWPI